jgi:hypothetical protein
MHFIMKAHNNFVEILQKKNKDQTAKKTLSA